LDEKWNSALKWYLLKLCAEEDLICQQDLYNDLSVVPRRELSKQKRLAKLLQLLLHRSEYGPVDRLLDNGILSVLFSLIRPKKAEDKQLSLSVLKILSNLAQRSRESTIQITNSGKRSHKDIYVVKSDFMLYSY